MKNLISLLCLSLVTISFCFAQTDAVKTDDTEVLKIAEVMPTMKGCEQEETEQLRSQCTIQKIQEHLAKNIIYPAESLEKGNTGTVYVSFIIDEKGNVTNVKTLRGVNEEMDQEAMRVVSLLPPFNPGVQKGENVKVQFQLPVKYTMK